MFQAIKHQYLVPFDGTFSLSGATTRPPENVASKGELKDQLEDRVDQLHDLQRKLYAHDKHSVLLVFQAMDAAGKDSTIRAVMSGINPQGCQVFSFKKPSSKELDHDFLWRTSKSMPERGRIGIFNRSYYEEVLVVRVHPKILTYQKLPDFSDTEAFWNERLESIADHEKHLARNGTVIIKFWLNVSKEEQKQRFLSRLRDPRKNWKFSEKDVEERGHWNDYMYAYEQALRATSKSHAPWYAIPADSKSYMRATVADIAVKTLESLNISYPEVADSDKARFDEMEAHLLSEKD